ncbi:hypothetical protein LQ50_15580 [Halalkalibacter okhensis]|uniref:Uncharacterized protein n=1 Tax=Halalkalibacter okhensis TaxID=333138 RepID=A0A0B0I9V2_9BACI|nr:hypothetical protein LQ50_15580 [Halalkalibacter okhensis]
MFFKKVSKKETKNWEKGCIFGFYSFIMAFFINQIYVYFFSSYLFSNFAILGIGLLSAFAWSFFKNVRS